MKERLTRNLGPDARRVIDLSRSITGKDPLLKRVPALPNGVRAMLRRPISLRRPYEIHFVKGEEPVLEHLVAHEIGHLVRLYQVPEAERLMPAVTPGSRLRAIEQLAPELLSLLDNGLRHEALVKLFDVWHQGVCQQLASFPADLRIEAWIHSTFPGLRSVQRKSLIAEVQRGLPSLLPEVAAFTPPTIYQATMAMNAAQACHVADLFATPGLAAPFERHGFGRQGRNLLGLVLDAEDKGHDSDRQAVNDWAGELRLTGWFDWRPYTGIR
jgi:hypothetical protein